MLASLNLLSSEFVLRKVLEKWSSLAALVDGFLASSVHDKVRSVHE